MTRSRTYRVGLLASSLLVAALAVASTPNLTKGDGDRRPDVLTASRSDRPKQAKPDAASGRIRPWTGDPRFWELRGKPTLLLGGSKDDNLFQLPDIEAHLDAIRAAGGNYVRNTMSDRRDKGFEVYPFARRADGKYDLEKWNDEYWRRFERFLALTAARDIVVQIEVWDRFDYSRQHWDPHPFNPKNNVNYTTETSRLKHAYKRHPGTNEQPFFFTVPALDDNRVVRRFQEARVDKLLSISLRHGHVLYCMDNETSGRPEWGRYWSDRIHRRAKELGVEVHTTEMWDDWNPKGGRHKATYDHPEAYSFVDISQNNHNRGQAHWDNLHWVRRYIHAKKPRPINTVKIYGADTGRFGKSRDGEERFWRNLLGGLSATRFHRPDSGLGLSSRAQPHLHSARLLLEELDIFRCRPDEGSRLLGKRVENEAYLTRIDGKQYAVYFPDGGDVELDLSAAKKTAFRVRWIEVAKSAWQNAHEREVRGGSRVQLGCPGKGHWVALITRR